MLKNLLLCFSFGLFLAGCNVAAVFTGFEKQNSAYLQEFQDKDSQNCSFDEYSKYEDIKDVKGNKSTSILKVDDPIYKGNILGLKAFLCRDYDKSIELFGAAIYAKENKSVLKSIGQAVGGALVNDNVHDYTGSYYELPTSLAYVGLGQLAKGQLQDSYMSFRRAEVAQNTVLNEFIDEQVKEQSKLYNAAQSQAQVASKSLDVVVNKLFNDNKDSFGVKNSLIVDFKSAILRSKASYKNTFVDYAAAVLYYLKGQRAEASFLMNNLAGILNNKMFLQDKQIVSRKNKQKYVWVIYENGFAPPLKEFHISIPVGLIISLINTKNKPILNSLDVAFSKLGNPISSHPFISANGAKSYMLSNMQNIVESEYKATLRTRILAAVVNTLISQIAQLEGYKQNGLLGLGLTIFSIAKNKSDVRYFIGLPKDYQAIRIKNTGNLKLSAGSDVFFDHKLDKNQDYLVYVKSPALSQFYVQVFNQLGEVNFNEEK